MLRGIKHVGKKASKFNFTIALNQIEVHGTKAWQPFKLAIVCTRRKRRISGKAQSWRPSLENPYNGVVSWSGHNQERLEISITFFRDQHGYEPKDWVFVLENETRLGKRRAIATARLNMADYILDVPTPQPVEVQLKPLNRKLRSATLKCTLTCVFMSEKIATEADMVSMAGSTTSEDTIRLGDIDIANVNDLDDTEVESSSRGSTLDGRVTKNPSDTRQELHELAQQIESLNLPPSDFDLPKPQPADHIEAQSAKSSSRPASTGSSSMSVRTSTSHESDKRRAKENKDAAESVAEKRASMSSEASQASTPQQKRRLRPSVDFLPQAQTEAEAPSSTSSSPATDNLKVLLRWCQRVTAGHQGVKVTNFTTSWRNGLALCAILHHYRPDSIDFSQLRSVDGKQNIRKAVEGFNRLEIPELETPFTALLLPDKNNLIQYLSKIRCSLDPDKEPTPSNGSAVLLATSSSSPSSSLLGTSGLREMARVKLLSDLEEKEDEDDVFSAEVDEVLEQETECLSDQFSPLFRSPKLPKISSEAQEEVSETPVPPPDLVILDRKEDTIVGEDQEALNPSTVNKDEADSFEEGNKIRGEPEGKTPQLYQVPSPDEHSTPLDIATPVEPNSADASTANTQKLVSPTKVAIISPLLPVSKSPEKETSAKVLPSPVFKFFTQEKPKAEEPENGDLSPSDKVTEVVVLPTDDVESPSKISSSSPCAVTTSSGLPDHSSPKKDDLKKEEDETEEKVSDVELSPTIKNTEEEKASEMSENVIDPLRETVDQLLKSSAARSKKAKTMELIEKAKAEALSPSRNTNREMSERAQRLIDEARATLGRNSKPIQEKKEDLEDPASHPLQDAPSLSAQASATETSTKRQAADGDDQERRGSGVAVNGFVWSESEIAVTASENASSVSLSKSNSSSGYESQTRDTTNESLYEHAKPELDSIPSYTSEDTVKTNDNPLSPPMLEPYSVSFPSADDIRPRSPASPKPEVTPAEVIDATNPFLDDGDDEPTQDDLENYVAELENMADDLDLRESSRVEPNTLPENLAQVPQPNEPEPTPQVQMRNDHTARASLVERLSVASTSDLHRRLSTALQNKEASQAEVLSELENERISLEKEQKLVEERSVEVQMELQELKTSSSRMAKQREGQLTQEWFQLVHKKNAILRQQDQLALMEEEQEILEKVDRIHEELIPLMEIEDVMKTLVQKEREQILLEEKFRLVNERDRIMQEMNEKEQMALEEEERLQTSLGENMSAVMKDEEKCRIM